MAGQLITSATCSLLSFAAGYFGFKIRTRWCPTCGNTASFRFSKTPHELPRGD